MVQVDPLKPKLKAPGTKRLKVSGDILLSTSALKSDMRRYIKGPSALAVPSPSMTVLEAGAHTHPLFSST